MGSAAAYARARESVLRICRGEADARTLRLETLDAIRRAVSFDAYAWLLTDPETSVGSSPLADVPLPAAVAAADPAEIPDRRQPVDRPAVRRRVAARGDRRQPVAEPDVAGTAGPVEVTDIASSVYRDRYGCWGFLDLWRMARRLHRNGHRVPRSHRRSGHRGAAARPGQDVRPRYRRRRGRPPRARSSCCSRPTSRCGRRPRRRNATCGYSFRLMRRTRRRSRPGRTTSPRSCSRPRPGWTTTRRWPACTWPAAGG